MPPLVAGINHCAGVTELRLRDGRDGLELARERATEPIVKFALETYGVLPYCWPHWTEFFPQMQRLDEDYEGARPGARRCGTGSRCTTWTSSAPATTSWPSSTAAWTAPDAGADRRSPTCRSGDEEEGIEVIEIMEAIVANRSEVHVVNARNDGAISNLPDDAVVEVLAEVNGHGVMPLRAGPLPGGARGPPAPLRRGAEADGQGGAERRAARRSCTRSCSTR